MVTANTYDYTASCQQCKCKFTHKVNKNQPLPTYCSKDCRDAAYASRKAERATVSTTSTGFRTAEGVCHRCGNRFYKDVPENDPTELKWCSKACRKKGQARKRSLGEIVCPHPYKKTYRTVEEASAFIEMYHPGQKMRPYPCSCGALHIGHVKVNRKTQPAA